MQKELLKEREKGFVSIGSGISDSYQQIEKSEKITRRCAEIIRDLHYPAKVMTKSSLIERDIGIWEKVHENGGFLLTVSLIYPDDKLRKVFEPGASPVKGRLETIKLFKERGIPVGVYLLPLLPFIADDKRSVEKLLENLKELQVDYVVTGTLTLRPGRQKELYMKTIKDHFPELEVKYKKLYRENRKSGAPLLKYSRAKRDEMEKLVGEYTFNMEPPHYIYKDKTTLYDEVYVLLNHMISIYRRENVNVKPLKETLDTFLKWLKPEIKYMRRRRNLNYRYIENRLVELFESDKGEEMFPHYKVRNFLKEVIVNRKTFNYSTLELE